MVTSCSPAFVFDLLFVAARFLGDAAFFALGLVLLLSLRLAGVFFAGIEGEYSVLARWSGSREVGRNLDASNHRRSALGK